MDIVSFKAVEWENLLCGFHVRSVLCSPIPLFGKTHLLIPLVVQAALFLLPNEVFGQCQKLPPSSDMKKFSSTLANWTFSMMPITKSGQLFFQPKILQSDTCSVSLINRGGALKHF